MKTTIKRNEIDDQIKLPLLNFYTFYADMLRYNNSFKFLDNNLFCEI